MHINIENTVNHQVTDKEYGKREDHNNLNIFPFRFQRGEKTIIRIRILCWDAVVSLDLLGHSFKCLLGHFIGMSKLDGQRRYGMLELASGFCIFFGAEKGVDSFCGATVCKAYHSKSFCISIIKRDCDGCSQLHRKSQLLQICLINSHIIKSYGILAFHNFIHNDLAVILLDINRNHQIIFNLGIGCLHIYL